MERKKSPLSLLFDIVDRAEDILCGGTLVCLLVVVLLQVFCRLVKIRAPWTEETTRFFFLWMMFLAVAAGFNRAESSRVLVLAEHLPRPVQMLCTLLYYLFSSSLPLPPSPPDRFSSWTACPPSWPGSSSASPTTAW